MVGCGGAVPGGISFSENAGDVGYVQLNVSNSGNRLFSDVASIAKYTIIISGEDLERSEYSVSNRADGVEIKGIPAGKNRTIEIVAINKDGAVLRRGRAEGITVEKGVTAAVDIELIAVPVFLNVTDQSYISNERLFFRFLSDPNHRLVIESEGLLTDRLTENNEVVTGNLGEVKFLPALSEREGLKKISAGTHRFTLRDLETGIESSLTLNIWEGVQVKTAPLFSGSSGKSRLGQSLARGSETITGGGEYFPNIAEQLWRKFW